MRQESSDWTKTSVAGALLRGFWGVYSGQFWHEWAWCGGMIVFQNSKNISLVFEKGIQMNKQLSKASDDTKHNKPLAGIGCLELI